MFFITTDGRRFICFSLTLLYCTMHFFILRRGFDRINNINKVIGEGRIKKLLAATRSTLFNCYSRPRA